MKKPKLINIIAHISFIILALSCIIPFLIIISVSISDGMRVFNEGYSVFPKGIDFSAYKYIFKDSTQIFDSYKITIIFTVVGTFISLLSTAMLAYVLTKKDYKYRRVFSFMVFFTMLFSGGLIPTYILVTQYLHLNNTIWAIILPMAISPWNIILMRTFFGDLPEALTEAAYIDGANEFSIFYRIVIPISIPAFATVGTFIALAYWNDWYSGLLYITDEKLLPLQYLLYRISNNVEELQNQMSYTLTADEIFPQEPVRMAMAVIAAGPMLFIFMFTQKYFVKGLTVGAVKE